MTTQALTHPRYRRGAQIHYERQRSRKHAELVAEVFARKVAAERAAEQAMREWCEEFPDLCWEEFCRDGGLAL